jgi:hypothetical protein
MIAQLIAPLTQLAGSWLDAKTTKQAAEAKLKLTEAEAKAKIWRTGSALWRRVRSRRSKTRW